MDTLFNSSETNPRGIPKAPFVENVEDFVKEPSDFELCFNKFQERLSKYKYMQESKLSTISQLKSKIPDIENALKMCKLMKLKQGGETESLKVNYQLDETLYTKAAIDVSEDLKVGLWMGADVMLEYPIDEAVELLSEKLEAAKDSLKIANEDVEFLRENVTTMEVNCARLYNWDVERRQALKVAQKGTEDLKI
ncbi:HBR178Cp [Eremothecium sinecaudum]|uniref:Prefoldin subunit 3 n=1 Tax=Eremothecium sinecaudum TaxID=45286 RepID=A0A120K171_9SACH|nr:HBR178Cp [Eremothecium sinecaudum]AMD19079.1 HBR178Cp [Eremothecium sinecaudum]